MENEKRMIDEYEVVNSIHIGDKELVLAIDLNNADKLYYMTCEVTNKGLKDEYDNALASDNFIEIAEVYANRLNEQVQQMKDYYITLPESKTILDKNSCISVNDYKDITGCVIVADPNYFRPEYHTPTSQVYIAKSGNGTRINSLGTAVYCDNLYTGEHTRLERYELYGVLKPECYPDWVKEKIRVIDLIKNNPNVFEYAGYHFIPVGNATSKDISKHLVSDRVMGVWSDKYTDIYGKGKINYSYEDFYKACNNMKYDVFLCAENGKYYLPAENELFEYKDEYKELKAQQKSNTPTKSKKHKEMER